VAPAYRLDVTPFDLRVGPVMKYARTRLSSNSLIALEQPYGTGEFGQVGARVGLTIDGRDVERAPTKGALIAVEGNFYPRAWSVEDTFGEVHGIAAVYATAPIPLRPTLALRAGGKQVWGRYPFHEAAYVGGSSTVRGLRRQRYAGDAGVFGNAELRLALLHGRSGLAPLFGVFGLADVGRVYLKGETSDRWHTGFGGGLWLSLSNPNNTVSFAVAESEGDVRIYLEGGFMF
jgi:outer membrane protein assembly factor BamA